ncbi:receptor-like protein EIX2 [Neltuma alba]|uniref:receptor-like protein EIX2 n=1 Tax=Neltuma alba TaxID=207710 RepID=UPI0010A4798B|nr:receptor-like protein EIX2 [Prosopis alba]
MGLCENTIVFILICSLTLSLNPLCKCKASDQVLCIPSERQVLLNFKQHLHDPSNRLATWSDDNTNCCNWTSVSCNHETGHILELHLSTSITYSYGGYDVSEISRFGGEIHPSILQLKELGYLDLSGNHFGGMQFPSFLCSMKSLTYLNLSYAGFSGSIPHQIGNLSGLLHLDLGGDNYFTGKIPHQIGNLSNLLYLDLSGDHQYDEDGISMYEENLQWISSLSLLQYLQLSFVNMSNAFDWLLVLQSLPLLTELHLQECALRHNFHPAIAINFSSLTILDLSFSFDFGPPSIPKWIFQLKNLVSLKLSNNNLQGFIPNGIHNLSLIEDLDLSNNLFNSSIPDWLYSLNHLKSLTLYWNNLHGTISNAIGNLTSMVTLALSFNQLEGPFPNSLSNLCNLRSVYLSNNNFNQQVSRLIEIISNCASHTLEVLSIDGSKVYGNLTAQIGIFKNLHRLSIFNSSIQGAIPISLGNLTSLRYLRVQGNKFDGNPFDVLQSLSELEYLDISDNLFCGIVNKDHLANFAKLNWFIVLGNKLTLKVDPNWKPSFQKLIFLDIGLWHLGPHFPSWILSLKDLKGLSIPYTNISDCIPTWLWGAFPNAFYFDFSNNDIHGELSYTLKNPINVETIDLSSNRLSGALPHISPIVGYLDLSNNWFSGSIASFSCQEKGEPMMLEYLDLTSNNLSGEIPDCWKMWSNNLMIVKFDNNHFNGKLPTSLGSLPWLYSLQLRNNSLSGNFPVCFKNSTKLLFLDLRENQFSGIILPWVGDILLNLKIFLLRSNQFNGKIPNQICYLNSLHILDLAQNDLTGQIPKCINQLSVMLVQNTTLESNIYSNGTSLHITNVLLELKGTYYVYTFLGLVTSIDLSGNKLCGEIPSEITSLKGLHFLNLSNNLLSGKIPQNIGNMEWLESMDLSENQLYGEIPSSMSNLNFLSKLNLSSNNLTGKIPTGTQLQTFEASSFVDNDLCGPPLPKNCDDLQNIPNRHDDKEGKRNGVNWFYVSMSLGYVLGFWLVVGPLLYSRSWRLNRVMYVVLLVGQNLLLRATNAM